MKVLIWRWKGSQNDKEVELAQSSQGKTEVTGSSSLSLSQMLAGAVAASAQDGGRVLYNPCIFCKPSLVYSFCIHRPWQLDTGGADFKDNGGQFREGPPG